MTTGTALTIRELSRWYGTRPGLKPLSLDVKKGDTLGVVGPNGAGKTTLLQLLAGHLPPTAGSVVFDNEVPISSSAYSQSFGYAGHELMLYDQLTPVENLQFFADLYELSDVTKRIDKLLDRMHLLERKSSRIKDFSNGMKRKLALCRAILHGPELLILDEPFQGIDASSVDRIRQLLDSFIDQGGTLVLSTHDFTRLDQFCNRMLLLVDAKPKWCRELNGQTIEELHQMYREGTGSDKRPNGLNSSGSSQKENVS